MQAGSRYFIGGFDYRISARVFRARVQRQRSIFLRPSCLEGQPLVGTIGNVVRTGLAQNR